MSPTTQSAVNGTGSTRKRNTSRDIRSASPVKVSPPAPSSRPKATPRKRRTKKEMEEAAAAKSVADSLAEEAELLEREREEEVEEILEAAEELAEEAAGEAAALEAIAFAEAAAPNGVADSEEDADPVREGNIRVSVTEDVIAGEEDETTHTTVKIEMPANAPDLALPQDTEGVVAVAREIIKDAKEMQENSEEANKSAGGKKRKAEALDEEVAEITGPEEIVQVVAEGDAADLVDGEVVMHTRPTKRTRVMVPAEEYRREKVKRRALMGLSGALAVG